MKKGILLTLAAVSLVMIPAEAATANIQLIWSGSWLAILVISAKFFAKLDKAEGEEEEV